jgi:iron complex outermembrane receptor protein
MMFTMNSSRPPLALALVLSSILLARSAIAQTPSAPASSTSEVSEGGLAVITVTARKIGEDIQSIPASITAIDARNLTAAHLTTLDDLNTFVTKKYVTKLPTDILTGEGSIEYGRYSQETVDGVVSGPIVPQRLLARLSVFNDRSDGFLPDPTLGKTLPASNETGGRLTLEYPGDQTRILFYLTGDHIGTENMNLYYTPPNDHDYLRIYKGGVDGTTPAYVRNLYAPTLAITHDFENFTFNSISSYFHSSITSIANFDKGALPSAGLLIFGPPVPDPSSPIYPLYCCQAFENYIQDFGKNVWSQELRLSSSGSSSFKWLAGTFIQRINSNALQIQTLGMNPTPGNPVGVIPLAPGALAPIPASDVEYRHYNRDYAIFGNASYAWSNWTVEAGLRIARFDNTMADTTASCGPCSGTARSNAVLLPTGSIAYHFSKDIMAYVTVARGDEEGDLSDNPVAFGQPNQVLPFKTEYALSYEAGVKSSLLDRRIDLNVAGFYVDYTNRLFEVGKVSAGGNEPCSTAPSSRAALISYS